MDTRLQILLQQYQLTRNPQDAVVFIENYLRTEPPEPIIVWICDIFENSENGSNISCHLTQLEALQNAAEWCLEFDVDQATVLVSDEMADIQNHLNALSVQNAPEYLEIEDLSRLINRFDALLSRGFNISVYSKRLI